MNKNILVTVIVFLIVVLGIVLFIKKGNFTTSPVDKNDGIIVNVGDKENVDVNDKSEDKSILHPPALPN